MENITSADELKKAIQLLEEEKAEKLQQLKEQSLRSIEILKPLNILKNVVKDMVSSPRVLDSMLETGVGLATGFLTKKIIIGSSVNIIRRLIGGAVQLGITSVATRNSGLIKSVTGFVIHKIFIKKRSKSKNRGR